MVGKRPKSYKLANIRQILSCDVKHNCHICNSRNITLWRHTQ